MLELDVERSYEQRVCVWGGTVCRVRVPCVSHVRGELILCV